MPITLVLLVFVFGSLVAASLPLAVGRPGRRRHLRRAHRPGQRHPRLDLLAQPDDRPRPRPRPSTTACSSSTASGRRSPAGKTTDDAVVRTMETAGRTVLFSAATVAVSLAALLVFPLYFLRSFAYAGIAVVLIAAIGAVVVLPALLAVLGPHVDSLDLRKAILRRPVRPNGGRRGLLAPPGHDRHAPARPRSRAGHRRAAARARRAVPRRPLRPARRPRAPDVGIDPRRPSTSSAPRFPSNEANALSVVAPTAGNPATHQAQVTAYAEALSLVPGVARVDAYTGSFIGGQQVVPATPVYAARFGNSVGYVAVGRAEVDGRAAVAGGRAARPRRPRRARARGRSPSPARRPSWSTPSRPIFAKVPWALGIVALVTLDHAVPDVRQRPRPGQGGRAEPAQPDRHVRRHGVGLPAGPRRRAARLHRPRARWTRPRRS